MTKLEPPIAADFSMECKSAVRAHVESSVYRSLHRLRLRRLDCVLLHYATMHGTPLWDNLLELREAGLIARVGASCYEPAEAVALLADREIKVLQIPFSILAESAVSSASSYRDHI